LVLVVLFSFVASFPLIFAQIETGQRRRETLLAWSRLQNDADSGFRAILVTPVASRSALAIATWSFTSQYPLSNDATLAIQLFSQVVNPGSAPLASVTARAWVQSTLSGTVPAGFDALQINAVLDSDPTLPASYAAWRCTPASFP